MRTTSRVLRGEYLRLIQTQGFLLSLGTGLALLTGSLGLDYASNTYPTPAIAALFAISSSIGCRS